MDVLSYQPHSGKYSPFPRNELLPISKFRTPSSSNPTSRQSSIPNQSKPADGVSQPREVDDVDGDESGDDELPSLQKLLSPATQACRANLKQAPNPLPAPRNPPRSHSLNLSVQTARSAAPTPSGDMPAPRKPFFMNVPAWSFLNSLPAQAPAPANQAKTNDDAIHNSSKHASRGLNEPAVRPPVVPSGCVSRGSSERESMDGSVGGSRHVGRGNSQDNPIVVVDDDDGDPTDRSNHTSHQMTVDHAGVGGENTDRDAGGAAHEGEGVANSGLDDATMRQCDNRSAPDRADGRGSDWAFDVFAEDDGWPPSKRARFSFSPLKVAENRPSPAAAVVVKTVEMPGSAHGDQEYEVHRIVGESGLEYEVTAFMKLWLPKALVDPKLVKKYRAEQRAATRVRTRWSSRLHNRGCATDQ